EGGRARGVARRRGGVPEARRRLAHERLAPLERGARSADGPQPVLLSAEDRLDGVHPVRRRPGGRLREDAGHAPPPDPEEHSGVADRRRPLRAPRGRGRSGGLGRRRRRAAPGQARRAPEGRRRHGPADPVGPSVGGLVNAADRSLRFETRGAVGRITLARPEVRNAFDDGLIAELTRAFAAAGEDPAVRVVVLAGEGPTFCAGADVSWMREAGGYSKEENEADAERMARMLRTIDACPKPVVALAHGAAIGG